jgi:hypothetical protein
MARVHAALRSWLESRLPMGRSALAVKSSDLEAAMRKELAAAGIAPRESFDTSPEQWLNNLDAPFSSVTVAFAWKPEAPDILFATAGVGVGCGQDEAVYGYRFDANGWARVVDDYPVSDWGYGYATLELSEPDYQGRRLLLIHRTIVQCASNWRNMAYSVYRIGPSPPAPEPLLSGEHGFYMADYELFVLKPDELIIEFLDQSVDGGVHNRTNILRYKFADRVKRLEPLAFQAQDFAEEWLTRPWSEMRSMSAPATQKWHGKLHADYSIGEYSNVVLCAAKPDRWSIGLEIRYIGEKELKEPLDVFLLVRDLGNYRYEMEAVGDSAFEECPGEGSPSSDHPWLSLEQLRALP